TASVCITHRIGVRLLPVSPDNCQHPFDQRPGKGLASVISRVNVLVHQQYREHLFWNDVNHLSAWKRPGEYVALLQPLVGFSDELILDLDSSFDNAIVLNLSGIRSIDRFNYCRPRTKPASLIVHGILDGEHLTALGLNASDI